MQAVALSSIAAPEDWDHVVVDRARAFAADLRANRKAIDAQARIPESLTQAAIDAGFFEIARPRVWGGRPVSTLRTIMDVEVEIAKGDTGSAWAIALVLGSTLSIPKMFDADTVNTVFASSGGARCAGVHAWRSCKVRRVDGGVFIEHGLWGFNSGIHQSNWDVLGIPLPDEDGGAGAVLVPVSDITILNDWDTSGLRGSGSSSVEVRDLFVPDSRVATFSQGAIDSSVKATVPKSEDSWLADVPMSFALGNVHFAALALGAAEGAYDEFLAIINKRGMTYTHYEKLADSAAIQCVVAEARVSLDLARSCLYAGLDVFEQAARGGYAVEESRVIQLRGEVGFVMNMIWKAVDSIASACGASMAANSNAIGRFWRDCKIITLHAMAAPAVNIELYGRTLCGKPPQVTMI